MSNSRKRLRNRQQVYDSGCTYEWRVFWSDVELIPPLKQIFMLQMLQNNQSWSKDKYLVVEGCTHNIKLRQGSLQVKKLLDTWDGYQIFAPKKSLRFPFPLESLADVFIQMKGLSRKIEDFRSLTLMLKEFGYHYDLIDIKKKRCKVQWKPKTALDLDYLMVEGKPYWSVCLEGKKPKHLLSPSEQISLQENCVEGYIDFFRRIKLGA